MTTEPEDDDVLPSFQLVDGEAWIYDPDMLDPASDAAEGVLAVINRDGALFVLVARGSSREWVNVEHKPAPLRRIQ